MLLHIAAIGLKKGKHPKLELRLAENEILLEECKY